MMECERELCQIAIYSDFSCEECKSMRRDEIDFVAEHPKSDMANVNRIIINGKVYLSADKVLAIINKLDDENMGLPDWSHEYEAACKDFRKEVEALKGGEQE